MSISESRKRHIWLFMRKNFKIVINFSRKLRAKKEVSLVVWKFSLHNRKVRKREELFKRFHKSCFLKKVFFLCLRMAAESETVGTAQVSGAAGLNSPNAANKNSPSSNSQIANSAGGVRSFGHIRLDISNSVLPLDKLSPTPSGKDGLSEEVEMQIRSLGCEVIQLSGKLLRLPQVSTSPSRKLLFCGLPVMF